MGGVDFPFQVVMAAIDAGKHVVTATRRCWHTRDPSCLQRPQEGRLHRF